MTRKVQSSRGFVALGLEHKIYNTLALAWPEELLLGCFVDAQQSAMLTMLPADRGKEYATGLSLYVVAVLRDFRNAARKPICSRGFRL